MTLVIKARSDTGWRTIHGTHVHVDADGKIDKGPEALQQRDPAKNARAATADGRDGQVAARSALMAGQSPAHAINAARRAGMSLAEARRAVAAAIQSTPSLSAQRGLLNWIRSRSADGSLKLQQHWLDDASGWDTSDLEAIASSGIGLRAANWIQRWQFGDMSSASETLPDDVRESLAQFKPSEPVTVHRYEGTPDKAHEKRLRSFSYNREVTEDLAESNEVILGNRGGMIVTETFHPSEILVDLNRLPHPIKNLLGMDEVIVERRAPTLVVKAIPDLLAQSKRRIYDRWKWKGLDLSIENPQGSTRHWVNRDDGSSGVTIMHYPYGYIRRTEDGDGEHVDVYVGPYAETAAKVYVVRQVKAPGFDRFDENKCMIGWNSYEEAKAAYLGQYNRPEFFGRMDVFDADAFAAAVKETGVVPGTPASGAVLVKSFGVFLALDAEGAAIVRRWNQVDAPGGRLHAPQMVVKSVADAPPKPKVDTGWRTIHGAHVHFGPGGVIDMGPEHFVGKIAAEIHGAPVPGVPKLLDLVAKHGGVKGGCAAAHKEYLAAGGTIGKEYVAGGGTPGTGKWYHTWKAANAAALEHGLAKIAQAPAEVDEPKLVVPAAPPPTPYAMLASGEATIHEVVTAVVQLNGNKPWSAARAEVYKLIHDNPGLQSWDYLSWAKKFTADGQRLSDLDPGRVLRNASGVLVVKAEDGTWRVPDLQTGGPTSVTVHTDTLWEDGSFVALGEFEGVKAVQESMAVFAAKKAAWLAAQAPPEPPPPTPKHDEIAGASQVADIDALFAKYGTIKGGAALAHKEHIAAGGTVGLEMANKGNHGQGAFYHAWQKAKSKATGEAPKGKGGPKLVVTPAASTSEPKATAKPAAAKHASSTTKLIMTPEEVAAVAPGAVVYHHPIHQALGPLPAGTVIKFGEKVLTKTEGGTWYEEATGVTYPPKIVEQTIVTVDSVGSGSYIPPPPPAAGKVVVPKKSATAPKVYTHADVTAIGSGKNTVVKATFSDGTSKDVHVGYAGGPKTTGLDEATYMAIATAHWLKGGATIGAAKSKAAADWASYGAPPVPTGGATTTVKQTPFGTHHASTEQWVEQNGSAYQAVGAKWLKPSVLGATSKIGIKSYTNGPYDDFNDHFRKGKALSSYLSAYIPKIDEALKTATFPTTMTISRKVKAGHPLETLIQHGALSPGVIIQDPAYQSSSVRQTSWYGAIQMRIKCPAGTPGLYTSYRADGEEVLSSHAHEDEVILPRNTKIRVVGYEPAPPNSPSGDEVKHYVYCEVVDD